MYRPTLFAVVPFLLTSIALAGPPAPRETIDSLGTKSDIIVVAQVVKVETANHVLDAKRQLPLLRQHATLKVLRAINTSDGKPLNLDQLILDYPDFDPDGQVSINSGPMFENFTPSQIAVFPLKRGTPPQPGSPQLWLLVNEAAECNTLPALAQPLDDKPAANAKDFLYRELASMFVHGNYRALHEGVYYLQESNLFNRELPQPFLDLLQAQTLDASRWVDIAMASYNMVPNPKPPLAELLAAKSPDPRSNRLFELAIDQAKPEQLEDRMLRALMVHQEPPEGLVGPIALALVDNLKFIDLQRAALAQSKPGAFAFMSSIIKDASHPLFASTMANARTFLAAPLKDDDTTFGAAVSFLTRLGSNDDFTFLLARIQDARKLSPVLSQSLMYPAFNEARAKTPNERPLKIFALFLDDTTPLQRDWPEYSIAPGTWHRNFWPHRSPPYDNVRVCDQAGTLIQSCAEKPFDFDLRDPLPKRQQALTKMREWLAGQWNPRNSPER